MKWNYQWWVWCRPCSVWRRARRNIQHSKVSRLWKWSVDRPATCRSGCTWNTRDATGRSCTSHLQSLWSTLKSIKIESIKVILSNQEEDERDLGAFDAASGELLLVTAAAVDVLFARDERLGADGVLAHEAGEALLVPLSALVLHLLGTCMVAIDSIHQFNGRHISTGPNRTEPNRTKPNKILGWKLSPVAFYH